MNSNTISRSETAFYTAYWYTGVIDVCSYTL